MEMNNSVIESPKLFRLKRRLEMLYSPSSSQKNSSNKKSNFNSKTQKQIESSSSLSSSAKLLSKLTKKKLDFNSPITFVKREEETIEVVETCTQPSKPISTIQFDDENSCDSGFSEIRDELNTKPSELVVDNDTDCSFVNEISFDGHFNKKLFLDSPNTEYLTEESSSSNRQHLHQSYSTSQITEKPKEDTLSEQMFKISKRNRRGCGLKKALSFQENFNEPAIKEALDNLDEKLLVANDERLVGDLSKKHALPILTQSKHRDLASITPKTLADLIDGKYNDQIGKYMILDARYPYEFQGGHIANAENAYQKETIFERLFSEPIKCDENKRVVIIFHCEFSSERGPRLMRELRERDRMLNKHNYPTLFYPEIYLLEGGYKSFFESHDDFCAPRSYLPMLHDNHRNDLKFFRKKSKTWELETSKKRLTTKTKLEF